MRARCQSDEPVDIKPALEKACHEPCVGLWEPYKQCEARVTKKGEGECSAWYFDYWKCVDKCVSGRGVHVRAPRRTALVRCCRCRLAARRDAAVRPRWQL